ncbi:glycosyltransferase family 4 protein [Macrococcoides caseolyticum]|uniref:glycosyltransferase family 4 protein n=1 Tax=Macrococcoides caseolyticum TaxID=69966 RepID=UPI001F353003|nr:glycosyltransferase family 4 protein [Macrococcus caseolyticus]MCE4955670.1 glycosyltransferase family 4 protein [Macrococcus caseolyticus]
MKIVQITAIDTSQEKLLKKLNLESKKSGFEVHCISSKGEDYKNILNDGHIFHDVKIDRKISPISNVKSVISIYKVLKKIKPDIVHVHTPVAAVLGRIAAKIAKTPIVIYTAHGFYFHDGMSKKKYKIFYGIEKYLGRYFTDFIFTQSEEDFNLAKSGKFLKNQNNYLWISNGIDLEDKFNISKIDEVKTSKIKADLNINNSDLVVSFIGRLVEEKGILDLLKAAKNLKNCNIHFIIMGGLYESDRDLNTYDKIQEFLQEDHIHYVGQVDNANEYLFISDIFCLPSYREGMPRSIIEAMSMKNAIIATNIRGSREEVVHEKNGYLVDIKDYKSIEKYILYLQSNPYVLEMMKKQSFDRAYELYNEKTVVEKQIKVFKNNCKEKL